MIAYLINKRCVGNDDFFDLNFSDDENNQLQFSLSGVIFSQPYTTIEMEERVREIALNLYPDQTLTQIVIE
jgi:hypothetical protein